MSIDNIGSIGQSAEMAQLLNSSDKIKNNINKDDSKSFEKTINQLLVSQLTSTLFTGGFFGAASEYSHLLQDSFTTLLADEFNLVENSEVGEQYDKWTY